MSRVLLVSLPFSTPDRPSLALSQLRAVLEAQGVPCDIWYANLEYAGEIGVKLYAKIAERFPQELLIGDLVFAPHMYDEPAGVEGSPRDVPTDRRHRLGQHRPRTDTNVKLASVDESFWEILPLLRERAGSFLDQLCERIIAADVYDIVGTSMTFNVAPGVAMARVLKQHTNPPRVVVGGACCDGEAGETLHELFGGLDFVCRGEGEHLLPELVHRIRSGADLGGLQGLIWRDGERTVCNGERAAPVEDLDTLPAPTFHDWLEQFSAQPLGLSLEECALPFESSRGCWYGEKIQCTYCGLLSTSDAYRTKSATRFVADALDLVQYGVNQVDAVDLILAPALLRDAVPVLAEHKHGLSIFYEVRIPHSRAQIATMKSAGIDSIQAGIESLSTAMLQLMRKGSHTFQNLRVLKWARELGVDMHWNILFGFPGEDPTEYQRMADLIPKILHLQPPKTGCTPVVLTRHSPLFDERGALGIGSATPVAAYEQVFRASPPQREKLAYFFDFEPSEPLDVGTYMGPLREAVSEWQSVWETCRLDGVLEGDRVRLRDSRPMALVADALLDVEESAVLLACDGGAKVGTIAQRTGLGSAEVERIAARLEARAWILDIDSRFLGLALFASAPEPNPASGTV